MKVYGIRESDNIGEYVYKDYHTARREAELLIDSKQDEDEWEEWREDYWTNGVEEIVIYPLKVI